MKFVLLLASSLVLLCAQPGRDNLPYRQPATVHAIIDYFELDATQASDFNDLVIDQREQMVRIDLALRHLEAAVTRSARSAYPNPTSIGNLVLEQRALRTRANEIRANSAAAFRALLDETQDERYQALMQAAEVQPLLAAFKSLQVPLGETDTRD